MKIEVLRQAQPLLFARFEEILKQNRLHHAYLFSGSFASFDMAQLLAKSLFCEKKQGVLPCGLCRNCRLIEEEEFSDVTVVRPVNHLIKTERIRELLRRFSQSGLEGNRQVFIICEADKMHVNAANSLLKVIEDPQSEIYIFLLTEDENLILPTVKSRTQIFNFSKNQKYITTALEQVGLMKNQAELLAEYSRSEEESNRLASSTAFFELAAQCQRLAEQCLRQERLTYLQVAVLTSLADDKDKQEQVFRLLEIFFAKKMSDTAAAFYLQALLQARKMWQANVHFQNALEYMILQQP